MKPPPFEYHAARSVDEAVGLLAEHGDEAKVLAGGQSLLPLLGLRLAHPGHLVDVNGVDELSSVGNGEGLRLGATVRHGVVERSEVVQSANPLLARAAHTIGHGAIRNRGTIGGSLAHADPAAELPAVLLALEGQVEVKSSRGGRRIAARELFQGFLSTSLAADELLVGVELPVLGPRTGWAFEEFSRRNGDFAIVAVAVTLRMEDTGAVGEAAIAFAGMGPTPVRATGAESTLAGEHPSAELWRAAASRATDDCEPATDLHGTAAYRRHLAAGLLLRSLERAHLRAVA